MGPSGVNLISETLAKTILNLKKKPISKTSPSLEFAKIISKRRPSREKAQLAFFSRYYGLLFETVAIGQKEQHRNRTDNGFPALNHSVGTLIDVIMSLLKVYWSIKVNFMMTIFSEVLNNYSIYTIISKNKPSLYICKTSLEKKPISKTSSSKGLKKRFDDISLKVRIKPNLKPKY